jgi:uncharacterized protein
MKKLVRLVGVMAVCGGGLGFGQQGGPVPVPAPAQVLTAGAGSPAEATVVADPAIWQVKGKHGTVYLFGSVHVMKPNVDWESAKVKAALTASDVMYFEIANLDDTAAAEPLALQFGLDQAHPLSTKLTKDDLALLDTTAKTMGLPGEQMFEPMQPWLVSTALQVVPMLKAGYAPTSGIDTKLLAQSRAAQKPIKGFETLEEQVHLLADLPQEQQVEMLHRELTEMDKSAAEMNDLVTAWEHGDIEKIGKMEDEELATKYPAQYKRLVVDRNAKWVATLDGLLKDPATGTVFVTVGAAHLAGPDSVLKMLEKDGWKVVRE